LFGVAFPYFGVSYINKATMAKMTAALDKTRRLPSAVVLVLGTAPPEDVEGKRVVEVV